MIAIPPEGFHPSPSWKFYLAFWAWVADFGNDAYQLATFERHGDFRALSCCAFFMFLTAAAISIMCASKRTTPWREIQSCVDRGVATPVWDSIMFFEAAFEGIGTGLVAPYSMLLIDDLSMLSAASAVIGLFMSAKSAAGVQMAWECGFGEGGLTFYRDAVQALQPGKYMRVYLWCLGRMLAELSSISLACMTMHPVIVLPLIWVSQIPRLIFEGDSSTPLTAFVVVTSWSQGLSSCFFWREQGGHVAPGWPWLVGILVRYTLLVTVIMAVDLPEGIVTWSSWPELGRPMGKQVLQDFITSSARIVVERMECASSCAHLADGPSIGAALFRCLTVAVAAATVPIVTVVAVALLMHRDFAQGTYDDAFLASVLAKRTEIESYAENSEKSCQLQLEEISAELPPLPGEAEHKHTDLVYFFLYSFCVVALGASAWFIGQVPRAAVKFLLPVLVPLAAGLLLASFTLAWLLTRCPAIMLRLMLAMPGFLSALALHIWGLQLAWPIQQLAITVCVLVGIGGACWDDWFFTQLIGWCSNVVRDAPIVLLMLLVHILLRTCAAVFLAVQAVQVGPILYSSLTGSGSAGRQWQEVFSDSVLLRFALYACSVGWTMELVDQCVQYGLIVTCQAWYFQQSGADSPGLVVLTCRLVNGLYFHIGSLCLGSLCSIMMRPLRITGLDRLVHSKWKDWAVNDAYLDMALTSSDYFLASQRSAANMDEDSDTFAMLYYPIAAISFPSTLGSLSVVALLYIDSFRVQDPEADGPESWAIVAVAGVLGFSIGLCFMTLLLTSVRTLWYCRCLERQKFKPTYEAASRNSCHGLASCCVRRMPGMNMLKAGWGSMSTGGGWEFLQLSAMSASPSMAEADRQQFRGSAALRGHGGSDPFMAVMSDFKAIGQTAMFTGERE